MGIKDDVINRRAENEAGQLFETVETLLAQETQVNSDVVALKATIKTDVASDNFNPNDLQALASKLSLVPAIINKKARYKTTLIKLRQRVNKAPYKLEIQAVIETL